MKKIFSLLTLLLLVVTGFSQLPTYLYGTDIRLQQIDTVNNALVRFFVPGRLSGKYLQNTGRGIVAFDSIASADVPWASGLPTYDGRYPSISRFLDSTAAVWARVQTGYQPAGSYLIAGNNLADVSNVATARNNLSVYSKSESDAAVGAKLNISDTANMLINYRMQMNSLQNFKLNTADTSTMLSNYRTTLNTVQSGKLNISDTANMLINYRMQMNSLQNFKLNTSDTGTMLSNYVRSGSLGGYVPTSRTINGFDLTANRTLTTDNIGQGSTNLYFSNSLARSALSAGTGISYNSGTGVISSTITQYTDALARAALSAGTGISYNSTTGVISSTITQYTDALARAALSAGTGISYNSTTGVISSTITQYTDALARASLSFAAGSGGYNSSTGVITIPTNTNQLTNGAGFVPANGTGATGTWVISISGNAATATSAGALGSFVADLGSQTSGVSFLLGTNSTNIFRYTAGAVQSFLGLGSNAYTSTAFLPLSGGTLTGNLVINAGNQTLRVNGGSYGNSGGNYHTHGYNVGFTSTGDVWTYLFGDFASFIRYQSGGFQFYTAPLGTAGATMSPSLRYTLDVNGDNIWVGNGSFGGTLAVTGAATAASFNGSGAGLTNIPWGSITGAPSFLTTAVTSATGTANQITVSASTGAVTFSLPSAVTISGNMTAASFNGSGSGLTGTASSLSIGGNAATVTNGVYTTGSYANPAWITSLAWSKITDAPPIESASTITLTSSFTGTYTIGEFTPSNDVTGVLHVVILGLDRTGANDAVSYVADVLYYRDGTGTCTGQVVNATAYQGAGDINASIDFNSGKVRFRATNNGGIQTLDWKVMYIDRSASRAN